MTYGKRLRQTRKKAGLTQQELSKISQVPQASISKIERDEQVNSVYDTILSHHLGIAPYWLTTGEGPETYELDEAEITLLTSYRSAPEEAKKALSLFAQTLLFYQKEFEKKDV